jgi:cysteinyl-tRNA synthetase
LRQAATSVDRLRNFRLRLSSANLPAGSNDVMSKLAAETIERMKAALEDDLNTAQAQAAIFEMVRAANAAFDAGEMKKGDVAPLLAAVEKFDEIFAVLTDDDVPKVQAILEWARAEGREKDISPEALAIGGSGGLSDAVIEGKVAEMAAARAARDFKKSDAIRAELVEAGVLVEITKDGIRWRRK